MRNEVKDEISKIEKKYMTQGHTSVSSDHNGGKLRIAVDFVNAKQDEADKAEEAIRKKYPHATVYTFMERD